MHFTDGLLKKAKDKGIKIETVTLHIGLGTFRPVQVEDLRTGDFVTVEDRYVTGRLDPETLDLINWEVVKGRST